MIEKAINNILVNDALLIAAFAGGTPEVYFGINPEVNSSKYLIFYRNSTEPYDTKNGNATTAPNGRSTLDSVDIQINLYSTSALDCADLAERTRTILDRKSGTFAGVVLQSVQFTNQSSMFEFDIEYNEKGVYQISQYFKCRVTPQYNN
tara:strand:- start:5187 stop:5633 length:447 start_codon:yes stop_codon:yes gene_type:complete